VAGDGLPPGDTAEPDFTKGQRFEKQLFVKPFIFVRYFLLT
jgi:hypothetical protein